MYKFILTTIPNNSIPLVTLYRGEKMKHSKYVAIQNTGERPVTIGWNSDKQEIVITPKVRMTESTNKHGMLWRVHALLDREIIEEYRRTEYQTT